MSKHKILFLAANPMGTDRLALDQEAHAIQVELERSGYRDQFDFITRWAVEPLDLLRELRRLRPTIVHFSGHGESTTMTQRPREFIQRDIINNIDTVESKAGTGLVFQTPNGTPHLASTCGIQQAFQKAGKSVKVVVLNACYSAEQARALATYVECVVGMSGSIRDDAARYFAAGFYGALGERESIASAFGQGQAAMALARTGDEHLPQLHVRPGVDADRFILRDAVRERRWLSRAVEIAPTFGFVLGLVAVAMAIATFLIGLPIDRGTDRGNVTGPRPLPAGPVGAFPDSRQPPDAMEPARRPSVDPQGTVPQICGINVQGDANVTQGGICNVSIEQK
jgi:hypothetical protein